MALVHWCSVPLCGRNPGITLAWLPAPLHLHLCLSALQPLSALLLCQLIQTMCCCCPAAGQLTSLHTLSLSSNQLSTLPSSITALTSLQELSLAGNKLTCLPAGLGALAQLKKLALNGNQLQALPQVGG
jgi:Leucine-rich repeat (LRR) protein